MVVLDVDADDAARPYPHKLRLARPDQHVAWRGDQLPDNSLALIDRVRGALAGEAAPRRASVSPAMAAAQYPAVGN